MYSIAAILVHTVPAVNRLTPAILGKIVIRNILEVLDRVGVGRWLPRSHP